jgi:integrase
LRRFPPEVYKVGRARKAIQKRFEGKGAKGVFVARFVHPLRRESIRFKLHTDPAMADRKLEALNLIFLGTPETWRNPPATTPDDVLRMWTGGAGLPLTDSDLKDPDNSKLAIALSDAAFWKGEAQRYRAESNQMRRLLERERGKKIRQGPCPTLRQALDTWLKGYRTSNPSHMKMVRWDLERFVRKFEETTLLDDMECREKDIHSWLTGLTRTVTIDGEDVERQISAERRSQIRKHVLRFLDESGCLINRKAVTPVSKKEIRRDRGAIRWLTAQESEAVEKALPLPWKQAFRVQLELGLRPSEVPTLKKSDITGDYETLTLSPLGALTLKTGSRSFNLRNFPAVAEVLKQLAGEILFPNPKGKPWNVKRFCRAYNAALKTAATTAGVTTKIDCRIPRRTCASLKLRAGVSVEAVAALLGDDSKMIKEHYGRILSHEV